MKIKYLKILLVWLGFGIILTTYLYLQPEKISETVWDSEGSHTKTYFEENHFEITAAIVIGVSLFIAALGLKKR